MKNIKIKIVVSLFAGLVLISFVNIASAAVPAVNVIPSSSTKSIGEVFIASVVVGTTGQAVYTVEGTLTYDNLSCKSIAVEEGLWVQSSPTCASPYFLIGIPGGTTVDKVLFKVSVNSPLQGQSTLAVKAVDIIGEGVSLSTVSNGGEYTITPTAPISEPVIPPQKTLTIQKTDITDSQEEVQVDPATKKMESNLVAAVSSSISELSRTTISIRTLIIIIIVVVVYVMLYRRSQKKK